jgi:hypothetical protein
MGLRLSTLEQASENDGARVKPEESTAHVCCSGHGSKVGRCVDIMVAAGGMNLRV